MNNETWTLRLAPQGLFLFHAGQTYWMDKMKNKILDWIARCRRPVLEAQILASGVGSASALRALIADGLVKAVESDVLEDRKTGARATGYILTEAGAKLVKAK